MSAEYFTAIKITHIVAIVSWFAGLFYLFRLFVYHVQNRGSPDCRRVFETMERRLLRVIMFPACLVAIASGAMLASMLEGAWLSGWLQLKITMVLGLCVYQEMGRRAQIRFSKGDFFLSERQCRVLNEVPTLLLIGIVILVEWQPF